MHKNDDSDSILATLSVKIKLKILTQAHSREASVSVSCSRTFYSRMYKKQSTCKTNEKWFKTHTIPAQNKWYLWSVRLRNELVCCSLRADSLKWTRRVDSRRGEPSLQTEPSTVAQFSSYEWFVCVLFSVFIKVCSKTGLIITERKEKSLQHTKAEASDISELQIALKTVS